MEETMARKGENIYKRKDGRWEGRYHKINMADGRQKYASVYGKTYKEVKEKLFLKKREQLLEKGGYGCLPTGLTIGEAAGMWLEERRGAWKESTLSTYRSITEKHILPLIGSVPAEAWDFAAYREYFKILREGKQGKKLSEQYLHQIHIILGQILQFLKDKYHCTGLEQPHAPYAARHRPVHPPLETEIRKLEAYLQKEALKGDVTCMGILLTGCSGIRIGELCALKWGDISFEKGTMHIGRTLQRIRTFCINSGEAGCYSTGTKITITSPKSGNSDREIPLPGYLLTLLQKWKGRQEDYLMPGRKKNIPSREPYNTGS